MPTATAPAENGTILRHGRRPTMMSDDIALRKQLQATHAYDERSIDTDSVLLIVTNILNLVSPGIDGSVNVSLTPFPFSLLKKLCLILFFCLFIFSCCNYLLFLIMIRVRRSMPESTTKRLHCLALTAFKTH